MFTNVRLPMLVTGFIVSAVLALSVHALLLQVFHVPYPSDKFDAPVATYLENAGTALALIWFCQLIRVRFQHSGAALIVCLFLIVAMLEEHLFRGWFMNSYCTGAWSFLFMHNVPTLIKDLVLVLLATLTATRLRSAVQQIAAGLVIAGVMLYAIGPLTALVADHLASSLSNLAPTPESSWCKLPYGWDVLLPAYLTFAEPALACLVAAAMAWDSLSGRTLWRLAQFTLIVVAIKNQLIQPFSYMIYAKTPGLGALASMGQFALEAAVLALCMGVTWVLATRKRTRPEAK